MDQLHRYARNRVFGQRGDPLVVERVGLQEVCPPHEHDFIEIVLAVSGKGEQETAGHRVPIGRGMLTVLRPGHWHAYLKCKRLVIYNCCFGAELLLHELAWLIDDPKLAWMLWGAGDVRNDAGPPVFVLAPAAVNRLKAVLDEFQRADDASYGMKVSLLCLFLTALARELPSPGPGTAGKIQPAVRRCIRLVESNLAHAWTVRSLAATCGCSPEYLIRQFKSAIGMTPYVYINRCRAERAAALLLRSQAGMAGIGAMVGWDEPCQFARRFKQHYGTSATKYRRQMRG